jgi:succinate dehydrogenase/fumarate reductase cytochrome b subunit
MGVLIILFIMAAILVYSALYKEKADAFVRKIRHSKYGFLYILITLMIIIIVILTES